MIMSTDVRRRFPCDIDLLCVIHMKTHYTIVQTKFRKTVEHNLLNIQMDHIPISLHISGSLDGKRRLKDRAPPNNIEA